jgi:hypothetical protein
MACTLGGTTTQRRPAFQMCLARAVTGPERFKGGTCSFGAPAGWGLSRADSNGRYAVGGPIIARIRPARQAASVTGLWQYAHDITDRTALPSLYTRWAGIL